MGCPGERVGASWGPEERVGASRAAQKAVFEDKELLAERVPKQGAGRCGAAGPVVPWSCRSAGLSLPSRAACLGQLCLGEAPETPQCSCTGSQGAVTW